ncbi:hypothetical protein [Riemerella anatipestifer]|uniref:Uncharacterized protein n=1 Tax=Riemerella anatipestifer TaxID=34085 RepID=A0AAP6HDF1_RIEAN|nr:hypothetical protein [Riemerella anatipestifer]MCO7354032.1 hypothetical protein [Riemerella anatipestifer]MCU7571132.1 hypothetical protein [Riemerella anatipestifer]MCU7597591.1 hypothetical protein [Riemerella anatipestifer]MCW0488334.1 hypothetical protein [Riemerella anatipestifer]MCW0494204.1 hypothetical protein [Riemerella anatipestifer]
MKKVFFSAVFFLISSVLMSNGGGGGYIEQEYVSFPMINSEIRNSMAEHEVQKELRREQTVNLATERVNRGLWTKYKDTTKKIQDRLRIVDFAIQSIPTGYAMYLEAEKIKNLQNRIIRELDDAPYAIAIAMPDQIKFVDNLQMTTRLLMGIVLSYGAINQMEKADRKILLDYALAEVKMIKYQASFLLRKIIEFKEMLQRKKYLFKYYRDRDINIIKSILRNVKRL